MMRIWSVIAIAISLTACQPEPAADLAPTPDAQRVRADLVGVTFDFYTDADGDRPWTIGAEEIRSVEVVDTARREGGARVRADVVLAAPQRTIRGALDLSYRRDSTGWVLLSVERAGPNFAVGDAGFVLYDVGVLPSDSLHPDRLSLDVIARFADGEWTTPLGSVRARADALFDSTMSDSLRTLALGRLADGVRRSWLPSGREVRVWAPGRPPRTVAIDSADVGIDGCEYAVGWARGTADANALGSTSSALGGTRVRALTGREARALDRLAAARLDARGQDGGRLRSAGALAADLDGDGSDEVVGAFAVGADTLAARAGIVVAARMASDGARLLFERVPEAAQGWGAFSLVGVADLDADGAAEAVLREEGDEVYRYRVVTFRAGRFLDAFRGGGGGC